MTRTGTAAAATGTRWRGLALPLAIALGWALAAQAGLGNPHIFVPWRAILAAGLSLTADGTLPAAVLATLWRMTLGFAIGSALGLALGIVLGLSALSSRAVSPTFHALRQIAIFAWMPLLTAWLGNGNAAIIVLVVLGTFFPVVVSAEAACRNVPLPYLEVARVFELDRAQTVRRIVLPAAAPGIMAGLEVGLASAWLATVGAEYLIGLGDGLGVLLASARAVGEMAPVIVGILALGLLGLAQNRLLATVSRRVFRWRPSSH